MKLYVTSAFPHQSSESSICQVYEQRDRTGIGKMLEYAAYSYSHVQVVSCQPNTLNKSMRCSGVLRALHSEFI